MFSSTSSLFLQTLLCFAISSSQGCISRLCPTCSQNDLQREFNEAPIVFRAKILSGPRQEVIKQDREQISFYDPNDVYMLKIDKIFKGEANVTELPGIKFLGLRRESIAMDFHTPGQWWEMCLPSLKALKHGREYLLSGSIQKSTLRSSFCDMRYSWSSVTYEERRALNREHRNASVTLR